MARIRNALTVSALAIGLASCSSGGSDQGSAGTSTSDALPTVVGATTSTVAGSGATTAAPGASTAPSFAPGQVATTTAGAPNATTAKATTTVASRVVSKPNDNVRLGDTGPGVKQIQTALAGLGYKVATDGAFGPQTAQAVKAFQKKSGITQDGIVGPVTWAKIQAASAAPASTTTAKAATTTATAATTTTTH